MTFLCSSTWCDRSSLAELLQTLVMVGQLIGAAFASSLSDRVRRKTVHLCSNYLTLVFGISVGFAPTYTTLAILKFILGVLIPVMWHNTVKNIFMRSLFEIYLLCPFLSINSIFIINRVWFCLLRSFRWNFFPKKHDFCVKSWVQCSGPLVLSLCPV